MVLICILRYVDTICSDLWTAIRRRCFFFWNLLPCIITYI